MKEIFNSETFKKTLRSYLIMLSVAWGVLVLSGFGLPLILKAIPHSRLAIGEIVSGITAIGLVAMGSLSIGIISIGIISVGVFACGATACGIIAIGSGAVGVIAIGIHALGVVAIGYNAMGIYTLSYRVKNRGRYIFSPERQDAKAVVLFTRWMPKLKTAFTTEG